MPDPLHDFAFQLSLFRVNVPLPTLSVPFNRKVFVL